MKSVTKTVFKVGDFVSWAKGNNLDLRPGFQRRSVWKPGAKSYLIDTLIKGHPIPIVFLRDRLDLKSMTTSREVVDGQQRLRTILSYINPKLVIDYDEAKDGFKISKSHNKEFAGLTFKQLSTDTQRQILDYEVPVHVFSGDTDDRDILQIFARLNATGVKLNHQELRNAEYFGVFKTLAYEIAYRNLNRWQDWEVFDQKAISRMIEVEDVSDLIIAMHEGIHGKTQSIIDSYYNKYDATYPNEDLVRRRFEHVMGALESAVGTRLAQTAFSKRALFNDLFVAVYHLIFGIGSPLKQKRPDKLPTNFASKIQRLSQNLSSQKFHDSVAKSLRGATSDFGSRLTRVNFILDEFGYELQEGE